MSHGDSSGETGPETGTASAKVLGWGRDRVRLVQGDLRAENRK